MTVHRIENGKPSVTMGSWFSVMASLGLCLEVSCNGDISRSQHPPRPKGVFDFSKKDILATEILRANNKLAALHAHGVEGNNHAAKRPMKHGLAHGGHQRALFQALPPSKWPLIFPGKTMGQMQWPHLPLLPSQDQINETDNSFQPDTNLP